MSLKSPTPPPMRRVPRPPRFDIRNLQPPSMMGSMPPSAQPMPPLHLPPHTAQYPFTAQTAYSGPGGQPYWPQYANPFAAGNFMSKGFDGFVDFTKSGMSSGEKFTYGLYGKVSAWSKKWFTHIFFFAIMALFSAGGALLFQAVEARQETQNILEAHALQKSLFQSMRKLAEDFETRKYEPKVYDGQINFILRDHQAAVEKLLSSNKTLTEISNEKHPWSFWNAMFFCGTVYTSIEMEANSEPQQAANTVRRRRRIGRPVREKTPDPNARLTANGRRQQHSDDDSSQLEVTTASEGGAAQSVRMQIRAPSSTLSAHESKILRRRDKTIASAAARSQSQPRQAERLSSPEAAQLMRTTVKHRSQSSPRHAKDENSENEVSKSETSTTTAPASSERQQTLHTAPIADENLNRLEQNLRRFEEERKRFEAEKRQFELEKREHNKLHHRQLDMLDERRRLLVASYRRHDEHLKLPIDDEERQRLVRSLKLQRPVPHAVTAKLPKERQRNRSLNYDESSTQFSSSEADAEDLQTRRQLSKPVAAVRRNNSAASNYSAPAMTRGPPPQPPERRVPARNHSLSPIRPQRRSKTPEQRAELLRKLAEATAGFDEANVGSLEALNSRAATAETFTKQNDSKAAQLMTSTGDSLSSSRRSSLTSSRRSSLTQTEPLNRQRKRSLDATPVPVPAAAIEKQPEVTEFLDLAEVSQSSKTHHTTPNTLFEKISKFFRTSKPKELESAPALPKKTQATTENETETAAPQKLLSKQFMRAFIKDARTQWQILKQAHPAELLEMRRLSLKCISHTIILIMLCGFGGLMFRYTEGTSENIYKCEVRKVKRDFIDNLWTVSHNMREDDWKTLARQKLRKFEEELFALQELGPRRYYPGMKSWNFVNCILYCWTVISRIGYGHITPKTDLGKTLTIIYAIIGIPLFLILLADFGKLFTRCLKFVWAYVRRLYYTGTCRQIRKQQQVRDAMSGFNAVYDMAVRRPSHYFGMGPEKDFETSTAADETGTGTIGASHHEETPTSPYPETFEIDDEFNLPISVASVLLISYILIGAFVYTLWEDWSYFDAFYFVFISMSTIGFGDLVPNHPIFMMCSIIYLVFGLALTSMFINVVQIKLSDTFKQASAKISATIGFDLASELGDEAMSQLNASELASIHGSRLEKISEDLNEKPLQEAGPGVVPLSPQQMPPSILRNARPISPIPQSVSPNIFPPASPSIYTNESEQTKKKKGFFFW